MRCLATTKTWVRQVYGNRPSDFDGGALRDLANGLILHPAQHFCPAGKLTWEQTRAREQAALL